MMKRAFMIFSTILILSPMTLFGGTFYNPDPNTELSIGGREAAEKLNESFVEFYKMLKNVEGKKFDKAEINYRKFYAILNKEALNRYKSVAEMASDQEIEFNLSGPLKDDYEHMINEFFDGREIANKKKLAEIPVIMIYRFMEKAEKFRFDPTGPDFLYGLRQLVSAAIDVQWIGVKVSELWVSIKK